MVFSVDVTGVTIFEVGSAGARKRQGLRHSCDGQQALFFFDLPSPCFSC